MDYIIKGDSDCPIAEIHLQTHETVKIERGSMAYMSNVSIEGKMNSNKKGLGCRISLAIRYSPICRVF